MLNDLANLLKINHYIKNLVVFVPLIFSMNFTSKNLIFVSLLTFLAFCMISSAVYIMNDLIDIENDRKHPIKCKRPIADGRITIGKAIFILCVLVAASFSLSLFINFGCFVAVVLYFILNIFYSLYFKHLVLIDATCIALGFIFRIIGGCFAIKVVPSPLIILMTFFTGFINKNAY